MDDATLASLAAALEATPANLGLRMVLVRAHVTRGEHARAAALLDGLAPGTLPTQADRLAASQALLAAGRPADALEFATGDAPELALARARALHALGRPADARAEYDRAIAANPTLEDLALKAELGSTVREVAPSKGGPVLRVIANDDTDQTELTRLLAPPEKTVTFADVGGLEEVKQQIRRKIILPFQKPSIFERFRKRAGGGILLYGPPGCGKTLLARATAGECKATFFNIVISDILDMYIGESERKLHAIFEKARHDAPAVLFFDEIEALAGKRQYTRESTSSKLVSQFLSEMDGFAQNNSGVLILGATNVPWAIDPAFRRPGRFDRVLFVPPPDQVAREQILEGQLRERPGGDRVACARLATRTSGWSGADLANLVETAADLAIERSLSTGSESPIDEKDLEAATREVKPTATEWLTTARNYARYANESGQYDDVLEFLRRHGKD